MASTKTALKSIKTAIDASDFSTAATKASELLKHDSKNYTGLLFLGFALSNLKEDPNQNQNPDSSNSSAAEKAYTQASHLKPKDPQALKGLVTLYEKQADPQKKLDAYHHTAIRLAKLYVDLDDINQCHSVVERYELFARKHGSGAQYRRALELLLPSPLTSTSSPPPPSPSPSTAPNPIFTHLQPRLPHPSLTYTRILESAETDERDWINQQIGERRTRLGARIDQVTQQVKVEAISEFQVEDKYRRVIGWVQDDEVRHGYEEKLLRRAYEDLLVLPAGSAAKVAQRDSVLELANGMVIIKRAVELAWTVALEWVDAESLAVWDVNVLREFVEFFPGNGLAKVLRGFLDCAISPFPKSLTTTTITPPEESSDDAESQQQQNEKLSESDALILMVEGLDESPTSLLSHRILAETYLSLNEFESAVEMARRAQLLHLQATQRFGVELQNSVDAVNTTLANALITYQSPRHHPEAKSLFEEILRRKPTATPPLLGVGLVLEEEEEYSEAVKFLEQALERDSENLRIRLELAWCRALDKDLKNGLIELEHILEAVQAERPVNRPMKSEVLYRIGYCRWHNSPSPTARKDKNGAYKYLLDSIKANSSFAPAYTLLGIYFADYGRSQKRARTAFQKAFELSTSEIEAAERLASTFADNGEWDLVELVAQRVVDSGKARPAPGSKKRAFSWPYAALGVVEMNHKQQYARSIVSFQAALRISPDDYHCWVGLGESYHNSGRYVAASRAFLKAESLDHGLPVDQTWFAKYMLANVQREMGFFDEAVAAYETVLKDIKPGEFGIMIALLQTLAESAWAKIDLGMFGEATRLAQRAVGAAIEIAESNHTDVFNLWKAVGDACSVLARCPAFSSQIDFGRRLSSLFQTDAVSEEQWNILSDIDKIELSALTSQVPNGNASPVGVHQSDLFFHGAILAHKRAIHAVAHDVHAQAVSWYNLGWAEHQCYVFVSSATGAADPSHSKTQRRPQQQRFLKAALRCFKRAIELEAGNSEFWNALGVVTMTLETRISQHSFVRSLHLNDRSATVWTNLGALCLLNNDSQLANEAFTRAQSADPEYAHAWLGQGLLATLFGNENEAQGLFTHAFDIADSSSLPTKRQYAMSAFDHLAKISTSSTTAITQVHALIQPLFALHQLHSQAPSDIVCRHLSALFSQRLGNHEEAESTLVDVCSITEAEYERSESVESLARFAQAKADLARSHLARREFANAAECAETALDLSTEEDLGGLYRDARRKWRLSSYLTTGLACHYLQHADKSIKMFRAALQEADGDPEIICMLAQVLWAKGGEEERNAAREQLFDCVETHPTHVGAVTLLGVMALLDEDEDALEAVEDDLRAMRVSDQLDVHDKAKVGMVLAGVTSSSNNLVPRSSASSDTGNDAEILTVMREATRGVMLAPAQPQGWSELAAIADEAFPARMALQNALRQVPPRGMVDAEDLSKAFAQTGLRREALQAVMVAPWRVEGYQALCDAT